MKTQIITLLALIGLQETKGARLPKSKRGFLLGDYSFQVPSLSHGEDLNLAQSGWQVNTGDFNLNVDLPPPPPQRLPTHSIRFLSGPPPIRTVSNSIDKPVQEPQEYVPPLPTGTVILPPRPPAAVPVNAVADNVPASRGAVFLGSGSIGVISLGNGAYALGSGSLGYSENRRRPRPTATVPVYPPIPATPDLLPAAVPTPLPYQPTPTLGFGPGDVDYGHPQVPQVDQNGYEYLHPSRVGFGQPIPPRPIKTRQAFATPTTFIVPQIPNNEYPVPYGPSSYGGIPLIV